ncbi:hypothetical protein D3C87_1477220 [compost metagenome]
MRQGAAEFAVRLAARDHPAQDREPGLVDPIHGLVQGLAHDVLGRAARQGGKARVDPLDDQVLVQVGEPPRQVAQEVLAEASLDEQLPGPVRQLDFSLLFAGDVVADDDDLVGGALFVPAQDPSAGDVHRGPVAPEVDQLPFPLARLLEGAHDLLERARETRPQQMVGDLPDHLGARPAIEQLGPTVPEGDPVAQVADRHRVVDDVEQLRPASQLVISGVSLGWIRHGRDLR